MLSINASASGVINFNFTKSCSGSTCLRYVALRFRLVDESTTTYWDVVEQRHSRECAVRPKPPYFNDRSDRLNFQGCFDKCCPLCVIEIIQIHFEISALGGRHAFWMWALNRCRHRPSEVHVPERLQNLYFPPQRRGRCQLNERFKPAKRWFCRGPMSQTRIHSTVRSKVSQ